MSVQDPVVRSHIVLEPMSNRPARRGCKILHQNVAKMQPLNCIWPTLGQILARVTLVA